MLLPLLAAFAAVVLTPEYLKATRLIDTVPGTEGDIDLLLQKALEKVAFQPFGLLVDKWRWDVFTGKTSSADYNKAWWALVRKYQGLKPGKQLGDMMAMGASRPWPEALEAATGQRELEATLILEYFAPLKAWLDERNKGQSVGWKAE